MEQDRKAEINLAHLSSINHKQRRQDYNEGEKASSINVALKIGQLYVNLEYSLVP